MSHISDDQQQKMKKKENKRQYTTALCSCVVPQQVCGCGVSQPNKSRTKMRAHACVPERKRENEKTDGARQTRSKKTKRRKGGGETQHVMLSTFQSLSVRLFVVVVFCCCGSFSPPPLVLRVFFWRFLGGHPPLPSPLAADRIEHKKGIFSLLFDPVLRIDAHLISPDMHACLSVDPQSTLCASFYLSVSHKNGGGGAAARGFPSLKSNRSSLTREQKKNSRHKKKRKGKRERSN